MPVVTAAVPAGGAPRPAVALVAAPSRVELAGASSRTVRVTNTGAAPVVVDVAQAGFALDLHGRPRVVRRASGAVRWLAVRPARLALAPGGSAAVAVSAALPRGAVPGDHAGLLLLTTHPPAGSALRVRMRLGIVVSVRVRGPVVRLLVVRAVRVARGRRRSIVEVALANRGDVTESLAGGRLTVELRRNGRVLARLRPLLVRRLLPRSRGVVDLRYAGRLPGGVTAVVELAPAGVGSEPGRRSFTLRAGPPGRR